MFCFSAYMWMQFFFESWLTYSWLEEFQLFAWRWTHQYVLQAIVLSKVSLLCIQTAAALQTWMLHYKLIRHAKAEELNKICLYHKYWSIVRFCVWVQSKIAKISFDSQIFPPVIAQREMFITGCSIKLCNTAFSTVHKNVPNVVLVLRCWVTGNDTSRFRSTAPLPVAHRAFYHICCFEMGSVIFVCLVFLHHLSLTLSKLYWTFYSNTPKLSILRMVERCFQLFYSYISTCLWM